MELLHRRCCGLDVHKETVVACLRLVADGKVTTEVRTFQTTTADLLRLSEWLAENDCTHVAMEATGVYWKPVWHILDDGEFVLVLANAAHVKNAPGRKTDVNDAMSPAVTVGARSDPSELRAGYADPGDAQPAAHAQAIGSRTVEPCAAGAEDTRGRQHQIGLGAYRFDGQERPRHARGTDCRGNQPGQTGRPCRSAGEGITGGTARGPSRPGHEAPSLPASSSSQSDRRS